MTLAGFLRECGLRHGFSVAVRETAEAALCLRPEDGPAARSLLTDEEWPLFTRLRNHKRRVEWLAGRLAARQAFVEHTSTRPGNPPASVRSVLGGADVPPYFSGEPGLSLSISHSHCYAVAVVASRAIGVDIEKIEHRPRSLADYFLSDEECGLLDAASRDGEQDELMTRLWARKEALAKLLRRGGELRFRSLAVVRDRVRIPGRPPSWARLVSGVAEGYCVALAFEADSAEDGAPHE